MNRTMAETLYANIKQVGLPTWSEADLTLARATQKELNVPVVGLATQIPELRGRESMPDEDKRGGGSDDIGDISWNVPTVSLSFPSNFQAGPGHNWANAIPMATPIAHKGVNAGAKAQAMTLLEFMMRPELVTQAKDYFVNVQTKEPQVHAAAAARRQAGDAPEQGHHGPLPAGDEEVLLRPGQVQDLPRSDEGGVRLQLPDRAHRPRPASRSRTLEAARD